MTYKYDRKELMTWLGLADRSHVCVDTLISVMSEQIHTEDYIQLTGIKGEWVCRVVWAHHDGDITETEIVANTVYKAVVQCFHKHLWDLRNIRQSEGPDIIFIIGG